MTAGGKDRLRLVVATHNSHKLEELRNILADVSDALELEAYDGPEPTENGVSFAENALIKARAAASHTGLPAIADDSGICVDVMGGAPGIFSARWAGPERDSARNCELLLWQLRDIAGKDRGAHFSCAAALVIPATSVEVVRVGKWPGRICEEQSGAGGFGYDPIFQPQGHSVSAAHLGVDEKNAMSHRARAFHDLIPHLRATFFSQ